MKQYLLIMGIIFPVFICTANNKSKTINQEPFIDSSVVKYKPNRIVRTEQFLNSDSLKKSTSKIEYYYDSLILKEVYIYNWEDDVTRSPLGEYDYYYDKNKCLKFKYFIDAKSGDTLKYCYKYSSQNRNYSILIYDCKKRLRSDLPHTDIILSDDLTKERIWLYSKTYEYKFNNTGQLIQQYEPINDKSVYVQNNYTRKYKNNQLTEERSYLNDTILCWIKKYEYTNNEIIMIQTNPRRKTLPYSYSISQTDRNNNILTTETTDNNKKLMYRYIYSYDEKTRLILMKYFNYNNQLKLTHILHYETPE